ncbi:DUF3703 domain-containing protein [Hydrogenophaga sp. BPS33]|uniref:DUF3703 domain-containing protein n=1 Tax=Hydrogenophaga sp. BPS33 TaxID=2651974 RepID=UPI00131FB0D5|nr:DUF3703 domain-containing protein [Hydrogenophaga sp. BPS33]QHE89169.1 DUF3703 domain-containing protein [Hydrogenophaga sp. BPS33]
MAMFTDPQAGRRFDAATHTRLMHEAKSAGSTSQAWLYLEAAHIVGQLHLRPHLQTHAHMLGLSLRTRDWPEAAGQMFRLALVPLGHLSGRLPLGNPGRSIVSAFEPMPVRPELADLIARASDH